MITVQKNKNSLCYLYYTVDFFIQSAMLFCLILLVSFVTTVIGKFISLVKQETSTNPNWSHSITTKKLAVLIYKSNQSFYQPANPCSPQSRALISQDPNLSISLICTDNWTEVTQIFSYYEKKWLATLTYGMYPLCLILLRYMLWCRNIIVIWVSWSFSNILFLRLL